MPPFARNTLVWIADGAWARLLAQPGLDDAGRELLAHWRARRLPLVVARPPAPLAAGRIALGLPAPLRWQRRRLALDVAVAEVQRKGHFPALASVAQRHGWAGGEALARALAALGVPAFVYGSHGWELLTGEGYLREGSDLDLSLQLSGFEQLGPVLALLRAAALPRRLDGEVVLRDGSALAWRECAALLAREVPTALVKRLDGVALEDLERLRRRADAA